MSTVPKPPHEAYVHSFAAAGDRRYRAQCRTCVWHGVSTGDKTRAVDEAADHRHEGHIKRGEL